MKCILAMQPFETFSSPVEDTKYKHERIEANGYRRFVFIIGVILSQPRSQFQDALMVEPFLPFIIPRSVPFIALNVQVPR